MRKGDLVRVTKNGINPYLVGAIGKVEQIVEHTILVLFDKDYNHAQYKTEQVWDEKTKKNVTREMDEFIKYLRPGRGMSRVMMNISTVEKYEGKAVLSFTLTTMQCAERYGISRTTWWRWVKAGNAPQPTLPRRWMLSELEAREINGKLTI